MLFSKPVFVQHLHAYNFRCDFLTSPYGNYLTLKQDSRRRRWGFVSLIFGAGYKCSLVSCIERGIHKYGLKTKIQLIRRELFTECFMFYVLLLQHLTVGLGFFTLIGQKNYQENSTTKWKILKGPKERENKANHIGFSLGDYYKGVAIHKPKEEWPQTKFPKHISSF